MKYRIFISIVDISANLKNIDIDIDIDKESLENIDIDIDIDKAIQKNIDIDKEILVNIDIDIDKEVLENIDIDINIDKEILENIDIDIDKEILENIDIDKILNRLEFGISNSTTKTASNASGGLIAIYLCQGLSQITKEENTLEIDVWKLFATAFRKYMTSHGRTCYPLSCYWLR